MFNCSSFIIRRHKKRETGELILPVKQANLSEEDLNKPIRPPRKFELENRNNLPMNGFSNLNNLNTMDIAKGTNWQNICDNE